VDVDFSIGNDFYLFIFLGGLYLFIEAKIHRIQPLFDVQIGETYCLKDGN